MVYAIGGAIFGGGVAVFRKGGLWVVLGGVIGLLGLGLIGLMAMTDAKRAGLI